MQGGPSHRHHASHSICGRYPLWRKCMKSVHAALAFLRTSFLHPGAPPAVAPQDSSLAWQPHSPHTTNRGEQNCAGVGVRRRSMLIAPASWAVEREPVHARHQSHGRVSGSRGFRLSSSCMAASSGGTTTRSVAAAHSFALHTGCHGSSSACAAGSHGRHPCSACVRAHHMHAPPVPWRR